MSGRSIGGIIPDVTIEEHHTDELTITDHPVEQGAAITDHSFVNPAQVTMRIGWSNSQSIIAGVLLGGGITDVSTLYQQMLDLQSSRQAFDLVTGKRTYANMLIKSVGMTTDRDTENGLILTVGMRQIIIVQTTTAALQPASAQSNPQDTTAVQNNGTVTPTAAPNQSALSILAGQ
jgi:hypothetical protein